MTRTHCISVLAAAAVALSLAGCAILESEESDMATGLRITGGAPISFANCDEPCIGITANAGLNALYFSSNRETANTDKASGTYSVYRCEQTRHDSEVYTPPEFVAEGIRSFAVIATNGADYIVGTREANNAICALRWKDGIAGEAAALADAQDNALSGRVIALLPKGACLGGYDVRGDFALVYQPQDSGPVAIAELTIGQDGALTASPTEYRKIPTGELAGGGSYVPWAAFAKNAAITNALARNNLSATDFLLYARREESSGYDIYITDLDTIDLPLALFNSADSADASPVYVAGENKVYMTSTRGGKVANIYRWNRTRPDAAFAEALREWSRDISASSANSVDSASSSAPGAGSVNSVSSAGGVNSAGSANSASNASSVSRPAAGVYIAGTLRYSVSDGSQQIPVYWHDGELILLEGTTGKNYTDGQAVCVSDDGIYVVGSYEGNAALWKNGVRRNLTNVSGSWDTVAYSVDVKDGVAHIAGKLNNQGCYWTVLPNGTITTNILDGTTCANAIRVGSNGTVHIAGKASNFAFYWRSDTSPKTQLGSSGTNTEATALALDESTSTIHIVGIDVTNAAYWKKTGEGAFTSETTGRPSGTSPWARAIWIEGNTVYIVGSEYANTGRSFLWEQPKPATFFSESCFSTDAFGVCTVEGVLRIIGNVYTSATPTAICEAAYWVDIPSSTNADATKLPKGDPASRNSYANGIYYYAGQ